MADMVEMEVALDLPVSYMARTRAWYAALGYDPYLWAHQETVPFAIAPRLAEARVALVTTTAPVKDGAGDQGPGAPYNAAAKFYEVWSADPEAVPPLGISHVAIDRAHTTAEDRRSYLPLEALQAAANEGRIGGLGRVHGLPTNRSIRVTRTVDCPDLVARIHADGAQAAVLVPNCPVCHQSCALAASALEASGVPAVVMGAARDIPEHVGVPRLVWSDVPLGNAAGLPQDAAGQGRVLAAALDLLEFARAPRTTVASGISWPGGSEWKRDYMNPALLSEAELARRRAEFAAQRATAKAVRSG
ncbi:MAG: glycine reductase [Pseudomonadota bacterium]